MGRFFALETGMQHPDTVATYDKNVIKHTDMEKRNSQT